jgi:hypothetical protein
LNFLAGEYAGFWGIGFAIRQRVLFDAAVGSANGTLVIKVMTIILVVARYE